MAPRIAVFDRLSDARRMRSRLLEAGMDRDRVALIARRLPAELQREQTIDGGALGEAMETGVELGVVAAIPIIGPILAMGPLERIATATQQRLKDAFEDFGCAPEDSAEAERAVHDGKALLLIRADEDALSETVAAAGGRLLGRRS